MKEFCFAENALYICVWDGELMLRIAHPHARIWLTALIHSSIYLYVFMYCLSADSTIAAVRSAMPRNGPSRCDFIVMIVVCCGCKAFVVVMLLLLMFHYYKCIGVYVCKMSERSKYRIQHFC